MALLSESKAIDWRFIITAIEKGYCKVDVEKGEIYNRHGRKLDGGLNKNYKRVTIAYNGMKVVEYIHRIIAYCKFGDKLFEEDIEVRHINNVKTDNRGENLELGSHLENIRDLPVGYLHNKEYLKLGGKSCRSLTDQQVREIREKLTYKKVKDIAEEYGVITSTIYLIKDRQTYKDVI